MSIAQHIESSLGPSMEVVQAYLADLSDEQLLLRPCPNANHIAWQLGHLIASERDLIEMVRPGAMKPLPEGFAEKYDAKGQLSASDDPADFETKQAYLELMKSVREQTLAAVRAMTDEELLVESPESLRPFAPTIGAVFANQSMHWMMHAGQWVIVRRILGKPALF